MINVTEREQKKIEDKQEVVTQLVCNNGQSATKRLEQAQAQRLDGRVLQSARIRYSLVLQETEGISYISTMGEVSAH